MKDIILNINPFDVEGFELSLKAHKMLRDGCNLDDIKDIHIGVWSAYHNDYDLDGMIEYLEKQILFIKMGKL